MEPGFKPDCVIPKFKLSNAVLFIRILFVSAFPVLHILNDLSVVSGLIISFMVQWMRDKQDSAFLNLMAYFEKGLQFA